MAESATVQQQNSNSTKNDSKGNQFWKPIRSVTGIFFIVLHISDIGSDIAMIILYYSSGDMFYCGLTFAFVLGPAIITNLGTIVKLENKSLFPDSTLCLISKWIFRFLNLGELWMLIELQVYKCRGKKFDEDSRKKYPKFITKKKFKDIIRQMQVWEALTESTPQLYLQLYIMLKSAQVIRADIRKCLAFGLSDNNTNLIISTLHKEQWQDAVSLEVIFQPISIFFSFLSITFSLTNYMKSYQKNKDKNGNDNGKNKKSESNTASNTENRSTNVGNIRTRESKCNLTDCEASHSHSTGNCNRDSEHKNVDKAQYPFILFFWQLCLIVSNMFSLSLFASAFTFWFIIPLIYRIIFQRTFEFCILNENPCKMSMSFFDTSFLTIKLSKDGPKHSRLFSLTSFAYRVLESTTLVALWCWAVDREQTWFYWWCVGIHAGGIVLQFIFMSIYFCKVNTESSKTNNFNTAECCNFNKAHDKASLVNNAEPIDGACPE